MKEAMLYRQMDEGAVQCDLCAHRCQIKPERSGICHVEALLSLIEPFSELGVAICQIQFREHVPCRTGYSEAVPVAVLVSTEP